MTIRYHERLTPSTGLWVAAVPISASFGLVWLVVVGPLAAAVISGLAVALAVAALLRSSAQVEVTDRQLRAGRAVVPRDLLGPVTVLTSEQMRALRGPQADARAYLCQRSWIGGGVQVPVRDPQDPVPYWLISSRSPQRLAAALSGAAGEPPSESPEPGSATGSAQEHSRQTG